MMTANRPPFKLSMIALMLALPSAFCIRTWGQEAPAVAASNTQKSGAPDDWSFHHLVFSNPGTREDAVKDGRLDQWLKITTDRRYQMQLRRRSGTRRAVAEVGEAATAKKKTTELKKDWSTTLSGAVASLTGTVGTLSSTTISGSSTLTVDSVTFDASPPIAETGTLTMGSSSPPNGTTLLAGGITYNFSNTTLSTSQAANTCAVEFSSTETTAENNLLGAMTNGGTGAAKSTSTWECNSDVTADAAASFLSEVNSGTHTITLKAVVAGSTGFTENVGSTGFTWATNTTGSDGTTSGISSPPTFAYWSGNTYLSSAQVAANIASAINANPTLQVLSTGVSATSSGATVTIVASAAGTGGNSYTVSRNNFSAWTPSSADLSGGGSGTTAARVQPNAYPAKFLFDTTSANCSDFVVYPTGATGATNAANIIAYNNLYVSGCSGATPSAFWAYNTGGAVSTSPVLSFDNTGSQVAYVQVSGTTASLVILKWAANSSASVGTAQTLTAQSSGAAYRSCSAPCYYAVSLGANDTFSAPFYDYNNDAAYVGDDTGSLHKITGVFNGTPTLDPSGFPIDLGSKQLSSPVYDPNWVSGGQVFVGDLGGVLHCVNASTGALIGNSPSLGTAIADAPLINSSANYVIAFADSTTSNSIYGFSEQFFPGGQGGPVSVGVGGTGYYLYAGAFDNLYYSSNGTGNIYVVGNTGATTGATLYQVGLSGGFLTGGVTSVVTGLNSSEHPWPSPLTEFCNGTCTTNGTQTTSGTDYVFFSVNRGAKTGCTNSAGNGCILSYNVSNPSSISEAGSGLNVTTPATNGCWATGGLIVDNSVGSGTLAGASQIYFVNLDGNAAGNSNGVTSSGCTTGSVSILDGVQAAQSNP